MPEGIAHPIKNRPAAKGGKAATIAWVVAAVYFFYQYTLRSSPSVMIPQLSEAFGMSALAIPICVLYAAAVGISELNDRRRARRRANAPGANLSPDEASDLDLAPEPVEEAQSLEDIL